MVVLLGKDVKIVDVIIKGVLKVKEIDNYVKNVVVVVIKDGNYLLGKGMDEIILKDDGIYIPVKDILFDIDDFVL